MINDNSIEKTLAANQYTKIKKYWSEKLSGELQKTAFPYDYNAVPADGKTNGEMKFKIGGGLFSRLIELSNKADIRLHMVLTAGLLVLLNKYTGNSDILTGTPIYKQEVELEFINTVLVLRSRVDGKMTCKELLLQVKDTIMEAVENQNYPVEMLINQLNINREEGSFPLFDVMLLLENIHNRKYIQNIKTGMCFYFFRTGSCIEGTVEYDARLYDASTVGVMLSRFSYLMDKLVFNINTPLSDIDMMDEAEKKRILLEFSNNGVSSQCGKTAHRMFEEQAGRTPQNTALVYEDSPGGDCIDLQVSYAELNKRANKLARYLRKTGVAAETLVGICSESSLDMVVGILGVMKAGGAYVPLDPGYPPDRLNFMINDSQMKYLITQDNLLARFPGCRVEYITPDRQGGIIEKEDDANPEENAAPGNLAYVIYTSGSTGIPKGVLIEHAGLCNLVISQQRILNIKEKDRVIQFASFSFDASVYEIFITLLSGATLCFVSRNRLIHTTDFSAILRDKDINVATLTPSVLKNISPAHLPQLRTIISAGENCTPDLVESWSKGRNMFNAYGPTENTVCATIGKCPAGSAARRISIGFPIDNVQIYILDKDLKAAPAGVPGELHIGGIGVARGYLNRPELTTQRFISNPFIPGARLYKSGDLARWLPDGSIEFWGRIDHQVKIRGIRIELEEIEAQLKNHELIKDAAVTARDDSNCNKYLCAYIVSGEDLNAGAIREYLLNKLPVHMVPSYFVKLDKLPLTANGKIDLKALPAPDGSIGTGVEYKAPTNAVEEKLVKIWQEVLGAGKIGINDNFFELGGHSLRVMNLVTMIHKELNVEIALKELFEHQTIAKQAIIIDNEKNKLLDLERYIEEIKELSDNEIDSILNK